MKIYVKALSGKTVRIPEQNLMVDADGCEVRCTPNVLRRLADGDLVKGKAKKIKPIKSEDASDDKNQTDKDDK